MPDIAAIASGAIYIPRTKAIRTARDPDSIVGNVLWLKSDESFKTFDGSNRCLSWIDSVTGADYANAAADATNPTQGAAINGVPTVQFTGASNQFLLVDDQSKIPFDDAPVTIGAVVRPDTLHNGTIWGSAALGGTPWNQYKAYSLQSDGRHGWECADNFNGEFIGDATYSAGNTVFCLTQVAINRSGNLAQARFFSCGQTQTSTFWQPINGFSYVGLTTDVTNRASIGLAYSEPGPVNFFPFDGRIAEIFAWNRYLAAAEFSALADYVEVKYGITVVP